MYLGDFAEDATVHVPPFTTNDREGAAVAPSSAFEAADLLIYKDNGATKKATANGVTMTSPFDSVTGLHVVGIDTSVDTGDVGFWTTGSDYSVVLSPDETVDGKTVVATLATFSIQNRYMRGTNSAALASVCTEARLAELDAANIPADVDAILADTNELQTDNIPGMLTTIAAYIDTEVAAILADTGELQTDWANGGRLDLILDARASQTSVDTVDGNVDLILADTGTDGVIVVTNNDKTGYRLSATGVDDVFNKAVEGTRTFIQILRGYSAVLLGKISGGGTATEIFRDIDDSKDRITATVDGDGNRTNITLDLT